MRDFVEVDPNIPEKLYSENEKLNILSDNEILKMIQVEDDILIQANAALSAARSNEDINELSYQNSYADFLPNVSLSYSYAWRENNTPMWDDYSPQTLMINFSVPLFTGFNNYTKLKSSYFEYKKSQETFTDQLQNIRYLLTEAVNKIINLKTQKELSLVNVEYNENNYRVVEQQKEQGLVSNIDFIDARINLQEAKLADVSNRYDFISSMVELYYLLGKLESIL
jgi:outer membrane protein TolC